MNRRSKDAPGHQSFWKLWGGGRAALYINKRWKRTEWQEVVIEKDVVAATVGGVRVFSVYSEGYSTSWSTPLQTLVREVAPMRAIVMGDFNLHHPLWDGEERTSSGVDVLLELATNWNLVLATPKGEPTWARQGSRCSTLDLIWFSGGMNILYEGPGEWSGSDHVPQRATIRGAAAATQRPKRRSWKMMDGGKARKLADNRIATRSWAASTICELESVAGELVTTLQSIRDETVPWTSGKSGSKAARWWTPEVQEATRDLRQAEREWRRTGRSAHHEVLADARRYQKKVMREAKERTWRETTATVEKDPKLLWKLARWGRESSHKPADLPKVPDLVADDGSTASSHAAKAEAFSTRFFPNPQVDNAARQALCDLSNQQRSGFRLSPVVTNDDVESTLRNTGQWKAAGQDELPNGFLRACGLPLVQALQQIASSSMVLGHFPTLFRKARVVVLRKPGKTLAQLRQAGGWRPISLLSCVGKVIEGLVAKKMTEAAEARGVLPPEQMGNRAGRSTELAARVVIETTKAAWKKRLTTSLLQLDLKGAFDNVNHEWLLATLASQGWPTWILRWTHSFLLNREACLSFDDWESESRRVPAGVPQGSPISPLLFCLFMAPLYDKLRAIRGVATIGFADDTNLLACGSDTAQCVTALEEAWKVCDSWTKERSMTFEPAKSSLVHFTRARSPRLEPISLGSIQVSPQEDARFLGIILDRKLSFRAHRAHITNRLRTQKFALSCIAAKTWGPALLRALTVYKAVIRSVITYAASAITSPAAVVDRGKAMERALAKEQNDCLRRVTGAYKSTPTKTMESLTNCPPINLLLAKQAALFEERAMGPEGKWTDIWKRAKMHISSARGRKRVDVSKTADPFGGFRGWLQGRSPKVAMEQTWAALRSKETGGRRGTGKHLDWKKQKKIWADMTKAQSSLYTQVKTDHIGFRDYLFSRKVPGVITPWCACGEARETAFHVICECSGCDEEDDDADDDGEEEVEKPQAIADLRTRKDLEIALEDPEASREITRWLMATGRLPEFALAQRLGAGASHQPRH